MAAKWNNYKDHRVKKVYFVVWFYKFYKQCFVIFRIKANLAEK